MSSNFNNAKIINVYYNKGDRKPYDVNGKPIAYIGEEAIGATEATTIRFYLGEDLDSSTAVIVTKRPDGERRLDICAKEGTGVNSYYEVTLNSWYGAVKGKATLAFKVYNGNVEFDDLENPTEIISVEGRIVVSDIFNLEIAYAPEADLLVPADDTPPYVEWFFALSTKLDKAQSITVTGALPTLTGDVYDDRYFYVEDEGQGKLFYINGSTAIEVVWGVGTLRLTPTGNGELTADTGKLSWNQPNGTAQLGLYNDVNIDLGEDVMYYGKASATITKGQVIQYAGRQGDHILMKPAVQSEINDNPRLIMGIAKQNIANNDFGYVAHFGKVDKIDTLGQPANAFLYFNSGGTVAGQTTPIPPTAPNAKVLMAAIIKSTTGGGQPNGVIQVRISFESKISDLQDVRVSSVQNQDVLRYNSSNSRWENTNALTIAEDSIDQAQTDILALDNNKADLSYTNAQLALKVDKTTSIIGIDLADSITLSEFKTALGNATSVLDGLMSSTDKTRLDALYASFNDPDGDNIVNTINEILEIFNNYPEGADLVTALNGKVDKIVGKGLSTNDLTNDLKDDYDTAYAHSQIITGNPHNSTPADIGAEPANANIQAHVTITDGSNPHQTTFANIQSKPTTITGFGITDAYDKTYIDGLTDFNGWQQTVVATALTNGQTVATTALTIYDRIMFVCRNTSTGELDTDEITSASVVSGNKINFFENASINFSFGVTNSTFTTTSGFELRITGALLTQQLAQNINTSEVGVTVQDKLNELNNEKANRFIDIPIAELGDRTLREVFVEEQLVINNDFSNGSTNWILPANDWTITSGYALYTQSTSPTRLTQNITFSGKPYIAFRISNIVGTPNIQPFLNTSITGSYINLTSGFNSFLSSTTHTATDLRFFSSATGSSFRLDDIVLINTTALGIDNLSKARLDYYFNLYQQYINNNDLFQVADALQLLREDNREQDKRLADIEENLRKANSGAITATASATDIISLGKDTNNAPAQMGVDGGLLQATQILTNPDFNSGTTGWTALNATNSVTGGILSNTGDGTNSTIYAGNLFTTTNNSQIYYIASRVRTTNSNATNIFVILRKTSISGTGFTTNFVTISSPVINQFYNVSAITTTDTTTNVFFSITTTYADASTANGKTTQVDYAYAFNISTLQANKQYSPLFNTTFDLMTDANIKTQMDLWVSQGVLPNNNIQAVAMNKRVRSVGKNLFADNFISTTGTPSVLTTYLGNNTYNIRMINFVDGQKAFNLNFLPNTRYMFSGESILINNPSGAALRLAVHYTDGTFENMFNASTTRTAFTYVSVSGKTIQEVRYRASNTNGEIQLFNFMIEQGTTATTYVQHASSDAYLQPNTLGYRVPNGVRDTIEFRNGKYYFVKRVQEYTLVESAITNLVTSPTGYDYVVIPLTNLVGIRPQTSSLIGSIFIANNVEFSALIVPTIFPSFATDANNIYYHFVDGTYANLASARTGLAGTKIYYELATPIETEILSLGIPQSYQGGTIYVDDMMADADLYTTNALISNTAYPIKSLDRIVRINADGSQTELAISGATIATNKLSFTHTGLVANDIVWFSYTYDIANTFKSLTTATYYDNPFIAVAPNGTARRLVPSVDNAGAVTWTSVAI